MLIRLSCKCTDGETSLSVRDRNEGGDIRDYMAHVQLEVALWHQHRGCLETSLKYMKMPITEGKPLGVSA